MLHIPYRKIIPYPFAVVLEQYFDLEHIAHVHPQTLGECVLIEQTADRIVYDQYWPADRKGRRAVSRIEQRWQLPGDVWFEFISGKHQGTKVHSRLQPHDEGTEINETYSIPRLPNWGILRWLIRPLVYRQVERIWEEDLKVGVCIGGWPGGPDRLCNLEANQRSQSLAPGDFRIGSADQFVPGSLTAIDTRAGKILIAATADGIHAMHSTCPHTGGPLELGRIEGNCVVCPWHGARFDLRTGQAVSGPTCIPLPIHEVIEDDGDLIVKARQANATDGELSASFTTPPKSHTPSPNLRSSS